DILFDFGTLELVVRSTGLPVFSSAWMLLTGRPSLRFNILKWIFEASLVAPTIFTPRVTDPTFRKPFQAARGATIKIVPQGSSGWLVPQCRPEADRLRLLR
ncbi:hypothetical protein, partial [Mesorhizobium sp. P5_C1]